MFQRILVPLDGSPRAERAIPVAVRIARASGGTVILVRAIDTIIDFWTTDTPHARLTEGENYLADIRTAIDLEGVSTEIKLLSGSAAAVILRTAYSSQADLIVLCSHGYTGLTRWAMGSVAEKVAHHATVPLLVLKEEGSIPADPHLAAVRPLHALVALDGSALSATVLEPVAFLIDALAAPATGALHLVRVIKPVVAEKDLQPLDNKIDCEQALHEAKHYLSTMAEQLHEKLVASVGADLKLTITWSVTFNTDVADAIVRLGENGEDAEGTVAPGSYDVIAMATHGQSGVPRLVIGSITNRVLNATRLPLLIVRPPDIVDKSHLTWDDITISSLLGAI